MLYSAIDPRLFFRILNLMIIGTTKNIQNLLEGDFRKDFNIYFKN